MCKIFFNETTQDLIPSFHPCNPLETPSDSLNSEGKSTIGQQDFFMNEASQQNYEAIMRWFESKGVKEGKIEMF